MGLLNTPENQPQTPAMRQAAALDLLRAYQPTWTEFHNRWLRTLVPTRYGLKSGDPQLDLSYRNINHQMDTLLERYWTDLNKTAFEGVVGEITPLPTKPGFYGTEIPVKHTDQVHSIELDYDGA